MTKVPWRTAAQLWAMAALGFVGMLAETTGMQTLYGAALATMASPVPKVFTRVDGLEPFSQTMSLHWQDQQGLPQSLSLGPQEGSALKGPYNRRNAIGAVIAAAPMLQRRDDTRPAFDSISQYALCNDAPILKELGLQAQSVAGPITLSYHMREDANDNSYPSQVEIHCP